MPNFVFWIACCDNLPGASRSRRVLRCPVAICCRVIGMQRDGVIVQDTPSDIAGRLRRARKRAQMDPAALRARLREYGIELSKTGLHRLETTEPKNPNLKLIEAIAEITHVSPGWILFGKGPAVPDTEVGAAIRTRVIDTIELMATALELTARQQSTLLNWLKSVRESQPRRSDR